MLERLLGFEQVMCVKWKNEVYCKMSSYKYSGLTAQCLMKIIRINICNGIQMLLQDKNECIQFESNRYDVDFVVKDLKFACSIKLENVEEPLFIFYKTKDVLELLKSKEVTESIEIKQKLEKWLEFSENLNV